MPEERFQRHLAAILAADVAGYSRLMEADEEGTLRRLQADLHELFEPRIVQHAGRLIKTTGDGLLAEFQSVVEAVRCAVAVQRGATERNASVPEPRQIRFRIGINLGDVIVEAGDIYGDGVNVAARLENLAEAGGILLSGTAYDHIKQNIDVGFAFIGAQRVKNIAEPVRVYRVLLDSKDAGRAVRIATRWNGRWQWLAAAASILAIAVGIGAWLVGNEGPPVTGPPLPDKPSVAVLPFANMSNDPKQDYFADGITDDLITDLSKASSLFVIARNSTAKYKGQSVSVEEVSKALGVRYLLEGTVQRAGEQVRINARLIDAVSGGDVWADRFDGSLGDVFSLQDRVTHSIADALSVKLTPAQELSLSQKETSVPAAYDAFLKGWAHYLRYSPDDYKRAIPYFEEAISLDPSYGRPYAALALVYGTTPWFGWEEKMGYSSHEMQEKAYAYLKEAKRHPSSLTYQALGLEQSRNGAFQAAFGYFERAIALDPSDSWSYADIAKMLVYDGRPQEAIRYVTTAMRIDPDYPAQFAFILGFAQFDMDQFEAAARSFEDAARRNAGYDDVFLFLAATYGHLTRKKEAASAIATYNELLAREGHGPATVAGATEVYFDKFKDSKNADRIARGLRLAGMPAY
jgi:adenylate cyclase